MEFLEEIDATPEQPLALVLFSDTYLADVTEIDPLPVDPVRSDSAAHDPGDLSTGLMAGDDHLPEVAHCRATKEVIWLPLEGHGKGSRHRRSGE